MSQGRKKAFDTLACQHGLEAYKSGWTAPRSFLPHYGIFYFPPIIHVTRFHLPRIRAVTMIRNVSSPIFVTVQLHRSATALYFGRMTVPVVKQCLYG
jgi:hypothetical protein